MDKESAVKYLEDLRDRMEAAWLNDESLPLSEDDFICMPIALESIERDMGAPAESVRQDLLSKLPTDFFDNTLVLSSKDLEGLPSELLEQLSELDLLETQILDLFELSKKPMLLDKIIVGLYRTTGQLHTRANITSKLYRMTKKGLLYGVPKKKGVYTNNKERDIDGVEFI